MRPRATFDRAPDARGAGQSFRGGAGVGGICGQLTRLADEPGPLVYTLRGMNEELLELVRIDGTGTAHPVGKTASQRMRARQGSFRVMPGPSHLIVMRYVGDDG